VPEPPPTPRSPRIEDLANKGVPSRGTPAINTPPDTRVTFVRLEAAVAIGMVTMSSAPLFPLLYAPTTLDAAEVVWMRYLWLPVYAATVFFAAWHFRALRRAAPAFIPTVVLFGFAAASLSWSIEPDITLRRIEALAFNSLLSLYLAARFGWRDLARIVAAAMAILAVGSWVMCVGFPRLGIHQAANAGAWRGVWPEKNELGFVMAVGAQASVACALLDARWRRAWLASALLCAALVVLSRSGTAIICLVGSIALAIGLASSRRHPIRAIGVAFFGGSLVLALAFMTALDLPWMLELIGKDPTLTGRTEVWAAVAHRVADRPILGYGYEAFWHNLFGPALLVRHEAQWAVPSAHNGWLEILLELGWVGAILAAAYVALTLWTVMRRLFVRTDGFWAIMYVAAFVASSLSESEIEKQNSLEWILFATISIKLLADLLASPVAAALRSMRPDGPMAAPPTRPSAPAPAARR